MAEKAYDEMSVSEKKKEDWMNTKWRPMMGWSYMLTCIADFVAFPVLWSVIQMVGGGQVTSQWQPITLQGAGLYHIAMGAVLGIAAFGRTQEKLNDKAGSTMPTTPSFTPAASTPTPSFSTPKSTPSFSAPATTSFTPSTATPAVARPVVTKPFDSDDMPPRD
jgi:Holin of 3TMs, for gene-transfer release